MSLPAIVVLVVGVLLLLIAVGALVWWLRTQAGSAARSFYGAVRSMEHDQGLHDRYQNPWLLMLGDERQGAELCAGWHLSPTGKAGWFGRWWADSDGSVLVVPDALFMPGEGLAGQATAWWRLLSLLLRLRARRPLDGVLWCIPATLLHSGEQASAQGLMARRKFIDLLQRLGLSLPVYVVVTDMEEVAGFQELLAALPKDAAERMLGWSSPFALDAVWQSHWSDMAVDAVSRSLSEAVIEIGALSGQVSEDLYDLPQQFEAMRGNLQALLDPVFQGNALGESPRLRGLYFTASLSPANDDPAAPIGADTPVHAGQARFARPLWRHRILAEQGLAQAVPRILRLRQRWHRVAGASATLFGVFWLVAMLWVWHDASRDADALADLLEQTQNGYLAIEGDANREAMSRHNVQTFWNLLQRAPRWHYRSLAYPTSWFSGLDVRLDDVLKSTARHHLYQPLRDVLVADLRALVQIRNTGRRSNIDGDDPESWETYVKANTLLQGALQIEQQNKWLAQALGNRKNPLDDLAQLANSALGLDLDARTLPKEAFYNRLLGEAPPAGMTPLNLQAKRGDIAEHFEQLMQLWLTRYFVADNFSRPAGYLRLYTRNLQAGSGNSLEELEEINSLIDNLHSLIAVTNSTWSRGSGGDLVPGYRALLDSVRQSVLLGPQVEQAINQEAAHLKKSFRDQWVAQAGMRDNLLVQQGNGTVDLEDGIKGLDKAIDGLFRRDFVASALRKEREEGARYGLTIDGDGMGAALRYFDSYKAYVDQELPQIPPDYRNALLDAAKSAAAMAMWSRLEPATPTVARSGYEQTFDVPADKALQLQKAFAELRRPDLSEALLRNLNQRALADVRRAQNEIEAQPVLRQRFDLSAWDGTKNLGLQLFRANDPQELKQSLVQQFAVMQKTTQDHAAALDWLKMQRQSLSLVDYEAVSRLVALSEEMLKYKAQNPASSPAALEQLASRDLVEMDAGSCATVLRGANLISGIDDLSRLGQNLHEQAMQRCGVLQRQRAALAWNRLADYFDQYLAGRFPFSYSTEAADADPERVRYLLRLLDENLAPAEEGLQLSQSMDVLAAQDFLARLKQARDWLAPLLVRDQEGMLGFDMEARWRTDRAEERGADQVIAWELQSGSQAIVYPREDNQRLRWTIGEPVKLVLRWAKNGSQRPANDPLQPNLAVADLEAGWEYTGHWALLRLVRAHISVQRQPSIDYTDFPLTLQLPVYAPYSTDTYAQMFMRVSLMAQGGKAPLSVQPLPVRAPRSPFADATLTAPLASSEVLP